MVAVPNFAPGIDNTVTGYDEVREASDPDSYNNDVEFYRDIYPLLRRVSLNAWVTWNAFTGHGHGPEAPANFLNPDRLKQLADPCSGAQRDVFNRLRNPNAPQYGGSKYMPILWNHTHGMRPSGEG